MKIFDRPRSAGRLGVRALMVPMLLGAFAIPMVTGATVQLATVTPASAQPVECTNFATLYYESNTAEFVADLCWDNTGHGFYYQGAFQGNLTITFTSNGFSFRAFGHGVDVIGHGNFSESQCPGVTLIETAPLQRTAGPGGYLCFGGE